MRYAIFISAIVLVCSCSNDSKSNEAYFKMSEEVLERSNELISSQNHALSQAIDNQVGDPRNSEDIKAWQPYAKEIEVLSLEMNKYIDKLASDFLLKNDKDAVNEFFFIKANGKELYDKLKKYKKDILLINPEIADNFTQRFMIIGKDFESSEKTPEDFSQTFFNQKNAIAATNTLHMFENNVRIIENNLLNFCLNKLIGSVCCGHYYEEFHPLITLSSNCVRAGDELEITAGIGSFSYQTVPHFTINGKNMLLNETAIAIYKFKTPQKAGKYSVPVKMEFTKPDGTREGMTKNIEYTVINPNQNPQ